MIKKLIIASIISGLILSLLALIPFVVKIAVLILITCVSVFVIIYLQRQGLLQTFNAKDSMTLGAVIGFVSFIAFSAVYIPLVYLISLKFSITYLGGFVLMLKLSNFLLMSMFVLFASTVSVIFNAFFAFLWYGVYTTKVGNIQSLFSEQKTFEEQLKDNNIQ